MENVEYMQAKNGRNVWTCTNDVGLVWSSALPDSRKDSISRLQNHPMTTLRHLIHTIIYFDSLTSLVSVVNRSAAAEKKCDIMPVTQPEPCDICTPIENIKFQEICKDTCICKATANGYPVNYSHYNHHSFACPEVSACQSFFANGS